MQKNEDADAISGSPQQLLKALEFVVTAIIKY